MHIFLYSLLFLLPFERIPSFEFSGISIRLTTILLLVGTVTILPYLIGKKKFFPFSSIDRAIGVYFIIAIISMLVAPEKTRSLVVLIFLSATLCGYLLISRQARNHFDSEKIRQVIIGSGFVTSLFGLYQFIGDGLGLSLHLTGLAEQYSKIVFGFPRVQSVGLEPLYFANFLLLPLFFAIVSLVTNVKKAKYYELGILSVMLTAFFLTLSRGAYAGFLGGLIVLAFSFFYSRQRLHNILAILICFGIALSCSYIGIRGLAGSKGVETFSSQAVVQNDQTEAASVTPRLSNYQEAWELFKAHPIIGVGIGNYGVVNTVSPHQAGSDYMIVNNQYLESLAETGILGLLALTFLVILAFRRVWNYRKTNPWIAYGLLATLSGILIQYNFLSTIYMLYVWTVIGLISALNPTNSEKL